MLIDAFTARRLSHENTNLSYANTRSSSQGNLTIRKGHEVTPRAKCQRGTTS